MKTLMILTAFLLCGTGIHAQTDCQAYMPIQEGSKWEISSYSKKDKLTSRVEHELIEKVINGNEILFILKSIAFDEKGEEIFSNTSESKCINGSFKIDMSAKIDPILLESYKDMDMHIDASDYTMPKHDEPVGTNLEDAYVKITIETPILLAMTINIS